MVTISRLFGLGRWSTAKASRTPTVPVIPKVEVPVLDLVETSPRPSSKTAVDPVRETDSKILTFSPELVSGRSARLNAWAMQLLNGAKGTVNSHYTLEATEPPEPLYKWVVSTGEIYLEEFSSLKKRPFAIVLYRYYRHDDIELVELSAE